MDPTTNLVTFAANSNNATAYNNYMMVESYLVVPTSGLTAAKAAKLAQYIRFVVGPEGQSDEETVGSAPPTPAMVAADLKVADQVDAEATTSASVAAAPGGSSGASGASGSSSTTTTPTTAATASTAGAAAPTGSTGNTGSGSGLASTGAPSDVVPVFVVGFVMLALGAGGLYRLRRVRRRRVAP